MRGAAAAAAVNAAAPPTQLCEALLDERQGSFQDDVAFLAARLTP
ncbi:hypothetical protein [Streptomyces sp. NPDC054783]